jgi:selenocysteine lyase/cysteine desulfurase
MEELGDFCRRKSLLFCVDAIQTLGVVPMDVQKSKIHFLATGSHKWLMSTMGCGAIYISKEINDQVHPEQVGWKSVTDEETFFPIDFDLKQNAGRFEPGTMNLPGIYALGAAIELLLEVGINVIYSQVKGVNDLFFQGLTERKLPIATSMKDEERSGILSFLPSQDPKALHKYLMRHQVMTSERSGMIRLSPHFFNNADDVNRFFEVLDGF